MNFSILKLYPVNYSESRKDKIKKTFFKLSALKRGYGLKSGSTNNLGFIWV